MYVAPTTVNGNTGLGVGLGGNAYGFAGGGGARVAGVGPENAGLGAGGLPGHIETRTAADGRVYFVNNRTHVTSWTPPLAENW